MNRLAPIALSIVAAAASAACSGRNASTAEEVEFRSGETTLSGTLVRPSNTVAAMVVVHGSGRAPREMSFASALADQGIATLTYDKRGVGKSGGVYAGPEVGTNNVTAENLDLLAADAAAAVVALVRRLPRGPVPVGFIGVSQAGWIIPIAALRSPEVGFMVIWSGPLVTAREQLRFQFFTDLQPDFWDHHTEEEAREHIQSDPDRFEFIDTDPREALQKLSIPGLWLFGGRDPNLPVGLSIERLEALMAGGKPFEHTTYPDAGHGLPAEEALAASMDWLRRTVIRR